MEYSWVEAIKGAGRDFWKLSAGARKQSKSTTLASVTPSRQWSGGHMVGPACICLSPSHIAHHVPLPNVAHLQACSSRAIHHHCGTQEPGKRARQMGGEAGQAPGLGSTQQGIRHLLEQRAPCSTAASAIWMGCRSKLPHPVTHPHSGWSLHRGRRAWQRSLESHTAGAGRPVWQEKGHAGETL